MKKISLLLLILVAFNCSKTQKDLTVKVHVKGLQKGTVYLKRLQDSTLINVDSVVVSGDSPIELYSDLEEPDIFFLYLDKASKTKETISFFAHKGLVSVQTNVKQFVADAKIEGSKQHDVLKDYQKLMSRLNNRNLDLIKEKFEAQQAADTNALKAIAKRQENLIKNRYLQTVNFAINHKDSEAAPYLTLSKIYDANTKFLDTIYKALTPQVKASKYGKKLNAFLADRKAND